MRSTDLEKARMCQQKRYAVVELKCIGRLRLDRLRFE